MAVCFDDEVKDRQKQVHPSFGYLVKKSTG